MNLFLERNFLLKATIVKILRKQKGKEIKNQYGDMGASASDFFLFLNMSILWCLKKNK